MADFKQNGFMYGIAVFVIAFVVIESVFFIAKAYKRGRELGISKETLKNTVLSSVVFSVAPAISILTTVIVLASALGLVLPWIRLSVIGNLAYETVTSETMLNAFGSSLSTEVTDPKQFGAVAWVMTIGTSLALIAAAGVQDHTKKGGRGSQQERKDHQGRGRDQRGVLYRHYSGVHCPCHIRQNAGRCRRRGRDEHMHTGHRHCGEPAA